MIDMLNLALSKTGSEGSNTDGFFTLEGDPLVWHVEKSAGAVFETTPTIDGKTLVLPQGTRDYLNIVFSTPLNLKSGNWTLEWSEINAGAPGGYYGELSIGTAADGANGITVRYGDSGFGDRMQFGGQLASLATCWSIPFSKSALSGVLKRYAMVQNAGQISVFVDGVKQNLATGTGAVYNQPTFVSDNPNTALTHIKLGSFHSSYTSMGAKRGPVRFNPTTAKYSSNYTPVPF